MSKPKIFIGSSSEGLDVANAIHHNLDHFAEVTIWTQGVFKLSAPIITSLISSLNNFDFAIFVFSPDDITILRGDEFSTVRDNVIFEIGLFAGKIGMNRVFFLKPRNQKDLHLPSDLLGVIAGEYESNRSDKNLNAATGPFCISVKQQILDLIKEDNDSSNVKRSEGLGDFNNLDSDLQMIERYLVKNKWTMVRFSKLKEMVHPKFTEEYVMGLVEKYPLYLRRCKLRDGVYGIELKYTT